MLLPPRRDPRTGDGLPGEHALADAMGVSSDTIRSAFAVLRDQGVIVTSTGIESFIAEKQDDGH
jgi:DNA-binding GntR family transcriptional regulator